MPRFSNKTVIVTGSSSGIGRSAAVLFAQKGAYVTITGRNSEKLQATKQQILKAGISEKQVNVVVADLTTAEGQDEIIKSTMAKFGGIDILINNAGAWIPDPQGKAGTDTSIETYHKTLQTNLQTVVQMTQKAKPYLIKSKGEIVNVSSVVAGPHAQPETVYYAMAKAALDQYTKSCSIDLIQHGVRVNSVSPGVVASDFISAVGMPKQATQKFYTFVAAQKECIPAGFAGRPKDIANVIVFLADRQLSAYIIGQSIVVDGGSSLVMGMQAHDMQKMLGM